MLSDVEILKCFIIYARTWQKRTSACQGLSMPQCALRTTSESFIVSFSKAGFFVFEKKCRFKEGIGH